MDTQIYINNLIRKRDEINKEIEKVHLKLINERTNFENLTCVKCFIYNGYEFRDKFMYCEWDWLMSQENRMVKIIIKMGEECSCYPEASFMVDGVDIVDGELEKVVDLTGLTETNIKKIFNTLWDQSVYMINGKDLFPWYELFEDV